MQSKWYRSGRLKFPSSDNADYNMLGYGIYFTSSEDEAKTYGTPAAYRIHGRGIHNYSKRVPRDVQRKLLSDKSFYSAFAFPTPSFDDYWYGGEDDGYSWDLFDDGYRVFKSPNDDEIARGLAESELRKFISKLPTQYDDKIRITDKMLLYAPIGGGYSSEFQRSEVFDSFYHLQVYLYEKYKSLKEVTTKLRSSGVNALYYEDGTTDVGERLGSNTLVVFNKNVVQNLKESKMQRNDIRNIIREELRLLNESNMSGAIYHFTNVNRATSIMEGNKLRLANAFHSEHEMNLNRGKLFYASFTTGRNSTVGYASYFEGNDRGQVRIAFDSRSLGNNNKIVPANWGKKTHSPSDRAKYDENEMRVVSYKSEIKNISKHILYIDVAVSGKDVQIGQINRNIKELHIACKERGVTLRYFIDSNFDNGVKYSEEAFRLYDTDLFTDPPRVRGKRPDNYGEMNGKLFLSVYVWLRNYKRNKILDTFINHVATKFTTVNVYGYDNTHDSDSLDYDTAMLRKLGEQEYRSLVSGIKSSIGNAEYKSFFKQKGTELKPGEYLDSFKEIITFHSIPNVVKAQIFKIQKHYLRMMDKYDKKGTGFSLDLSQVTDRRFIFARKLGAKNAAFLRDEFGGK
jgi:hypothetical protein